MVDTVSRRLTNVPSALMDIVIPDDYPPTYANLEQPDLQRLAPYGAVRLYTSRAADRDELFARLSSAEVVINVRAYTALDEEAFAHAPALRMISILGTGTDNVDLAAAARRGITVTNTPAVGAPSVAELTLGLILAVVRAIPVGLLLDGGAGSADPRHGRIVAAARSIAASSNGRKSLSVRRRSSAAGSRK